MKFSKTIIERLPYVFTEFLVVVFGILVAFWLNDWAENRNQAKLEQGYLVAIQADLERDSVELESNLRRAFKRMKTASQLIYSATGDSSQDLIMRRLDSERTQRRIQTMEDTPDCSRTSLIGCLNDTRIFDGNRGTFDALTSSGDIALIKNKDLQTQISSYYAYTLSNIEGEVRTVIPAESQLFDLLREQGISRNGLFHSGSENLIHLLKTEKELWAATVNIFASAYFQVTLTEGHITQLQNLMAAIESELDD